MGKKLARVRYEDVPAAACRISHPSIRLELVDEEEDEEDAEGDGSSSSSDDDDDDATAAAGDDESSDDDEAKAGEGDESSDDDDDETDDKPKAGARRFRMVANTGAPMELGYYWGRFMIDLSGVRFSQKTAALMDHDTSKRVGFTEKIEVTDEGLVAEGVMLGNQLASEIMADADGGFPWQSSVWLEPEEVERVGEGEFAMVNGKRVDGPVSIARKGELREVSFVALGADSAATSEAIAASSEKRSVRCKITGSGKKPAKAAAGRMQRKPARAAADPVKLTLEQLEDTNPDLVESIRLAAGEEATKAERARVASIFGACDEVQLQLGAELVSKGISEKRALSQINDDLRERLQLKKSGTIETEQSERSVSSGNSADPLPPSKDAIRAQFPDDDRGQKAYEAYIRNSKTNG